MYDLMTLSLDAWPVDDFYLSVFNSSHVSGLKFTIFADELDTSKVKLCLTLIDMA